MPVESSYFMCSEFAKNDPGDVVSKGEGCLKVENQIYEYIQYSIVSVL